MELVEELKNIISHYLDGSKTRSRMTLAAESGVSYNTISRILQNDNIPSLQSVIRILRVILPHDKILAFVESHYPEVSDIIKLRIEKEEKVQDYDQDVFDELLDNQMNFLIICMAARADGVSKDEVLREMGEAGWIKVVNLMQKNVITEKENRFYAEEFHLSNYRSILTAFSHTLETIRDRYDQMNSMHLSWRTDGFNEEGIKKILEILRNADLEMQKLRMDRKWQGNIPFFAGTLLGTIPS